VTKVGRASPYIHAVSLVPQSLDGMFLMLSGEGGTNVLAYRYQSNQWIAANTAGDFGWFSFCSQGLQATVRALAIDSRGHIYVGGSFISAGGISANRIAKWGGVSWSALGTGLNSTVRALLIGNDDVVYVGGDFTTAGGAQIRYLASWDGQRWGKVGAVPNGMVTSITRDLDGALLVAGAFSSIGTMPADRIAKWNGTSWLSFGVAANTTVNAACRSPSGQRIVASMKTIGKSRYTSWLQPGFADLDV
jgi:hypothetical protein